MRLRNALRLTAAAAPPAAPRSWQGERTPMAGGLTWPMPEEWSSRFVTRRMALSIPSCAQGVTLISSTAAGLPLYRWRDRVKLEDRALIGQPTPGVPGVVTYTDTLVDVVLHGRAHWLVLTRSRVDGRALTAMHVRAEDVDDDPLLDPDNVRIGLETYRRADVITFHGPMAGGILGNGGDALLTAYLLERAAQRYARSPVPSTALKNTSGVDLDDDEVDDLLAQWNAARANGATAYLNAAVDLERYGWSSAELQLVDARRDADARIGQLLNLPPTYVNAPDASSAGGYANLETRRRDLVDLSLRPYLDAVAGRLSLDDVTPRGTTVEYDLAGFLRSDLAALVTTGVAAVEAGLVSVLEWRRMAGLPDTPPTETDETPAGAAS